MAQQWSVVKANNPRLAKHSIEQIGIHVYMPETVIRVRHGRRHELQRKPLLFSYLFALFDLEIDRWQDLFSRRGVETVMAHGGVPIAVPAGQINRVREIAAPYENVVCDAVPLQEGQIVRIIDGCFSSFSGIVTDASKPLDVTVEVDIFGRASPVILPRDCVAPAA